MLESSRAISNGETTMFSPSVYVELAWSTLLNDASAAVENPSAAAENSSAVADDPSAAVDNPSAAVCDPSIERLVRLCFIESRGDGDIPVTADRPEGATYAIESHAVISTYGQSCITVITHQLRTASVCGYTGRRWRGRRLQAIGCSRRQCNCIIRRRRVCR